MFNRISKKDGFTLLELLVVMVIIGLLAGYVAPRYFAQIGKSETKAARAQIDARLKKHWRSIVWTQAVTPAPNKAWRR